MLPPTTIATTQIDAPVKIKGLTTRPHAPSERMGLRYIDLSSYSDYSCSYDRNWYGGWNGG